VTDQLAHPGVPAAAPTAASPDSPGRVLSTLNSDGSRHWIRPRLATGRFWQIRRIVAYSLIAVFASIPYLKLGGKPLVRLDIVNREFTFFGKTFLPTDSLLMAIVVVSAIVTIFLATSLVGRVWCGWACPQTVYMEFVFRPIERLLEGSPGRRGPSPAALPVRKAVKFALFLLLSMFLAHIFLAYFVGVDQLFHWVRSSPFNHPVAFAIMIATTGLMLFDFGYFREQMCIVTCPYGRFQSVMLDRRSLVVSYDRARGEPRGRAVRAVAKPAATVSLPILGGPALESAESDHAHEHGDGDDCCGSCTRGSGKGSCGRSRPETAPAAVSLPATDAAPRTADCVDCGMCVAVCPTGIDIRNGLQMECINCTQCIDACDAVMATLKRPRGLIKYSSQAASEESAPNSLPPSRFRHRVIVYSAILGALLTALIFLLATSRSADIAILRGRGTPFYESADGSVTNQLTMKSVNRERTQAVYSVTIDSPAGARLTGERTSVTVAQGGQELLPLVVSVPKRAFEHGHCDAVFRVSDERGRTQLLNFRLLGPDRKEHDKDEKHETQTESAKDHQ